KVIKYNHLVSNCIIFYNVFSLSRILQEYMQDGNSNDYEFTSYLSSYVTAHVNRFGKYHIEFKHKLQEIPIYISDAQDNDLSSLSHYVTAHFNRFGKYQIDFKRKPPELPFDISVAQPNDLSTLYHSESAQTSWKGPSEKSS